MPAPTVSSPPLAENAAGCPVVAAALDASGRFRTWRVLHTLGWVPGQRLDSKLDGSLVVIRPDPAGQCRVTPRGLLALPIAARRWLAIDPTRAAVVIGVAVPPQRMLSATIVSGREISCRLASPTMTADEDPDGATGYDETSPAAD